MKKILFITGTRADFGKLKPLILAVQNKTNYECMVFVTGMHTLDRYGYTADEVINKSGIKKYHVYYNQLIGEPMDLILANTINGLSRFAMEYKPDMIIVHGDRVETISGAIVGAINNILVAHIEGGEVSGTIDESIRHSVSKLAHIHFVSNKKAKRRLLKMGEDYNNIHIIGSPEIDIMLGKLPPLDFVKKHYNINFDNYAIAILNPVTTEEIKTSEFISGLRGSELNYLLIFPNNDTGSDKIFKFYYTIGDNRFKIFTSIRFEYFLTLLKNAQFIIGNSSCGVREAPVYGTPCINIGNRQNKRSNHRGIINTELIYNNIHKAIKKALIMKRVPKKVFGHGHSVENFLKCLPKTFNTPIQKEFCD